MTDWTSPLPGSLDRVAFEGGRLDEVCGSKGAHLEYMGGGKWFLIVGHDDGSQTAIWFRSKDLMKPFMERRAPRT